MMSWQDLREAKVGRSPAGRADWIGEPPPDEGLRLYLDVIRARLLFVALVVAITVASAAVLVVRADEVYRAEADMLVTPIPRTHETLFGLGLVTETGDPTRDAETLAKLITTPEVAQRVRRDLGTTRTPRELLRAVEALPVAQTSIVTITAEDSDPDLAARLANAFGSAAIEVRTERLHRLLDEVIPQLQAQLAAVPQRELRVRETLRGRLSDLESLRLAPDPTLHLETRAVPPNSRVAPRPALTIAAALIGGLILAIGTVLGAHVLAPRIEREEDLQRYRIPILGRIPLERRWQRARLRGRRPLSPSELSFEAREAFRRLASLLAAGAHGEDTTLFVTSPAAGDGKTTTSVNLASGLAALNETVVLVDADSRQPSLAGLLPATPKHGLTDVVMARAPLAEALSSANGLSGVRVLAQKPGDSSSSIPIRPEAADELVREARLHAGWLIFDGPVLTSAPDALPLARRARVLLVVRLRRTPARYLADLAELLVQQGLTPDGFVVIGGKPPPIY